MNLIEMFSQSQLAPVDKRRIHDSTLLELLTCAFFIGSESQLRKQSDQTREQSRACLVTLLMRVCKLGELKVGALIDSIENLSNKYYLVKNVFEQGQDAAEQWLNCEDADNSVLNELLNKYKDLTMFELGIEGVNEKYIAQQENLYQSTRKAVSQLRNRALFIILIIAAVIGGVAAYLYYFQ